MSATFLYIAHMYFFVHTLGHDECLPMLSSVAEVTFVNEFGLYTMLVSPPREFQETLLSKV